MDVHQFRTLRHLCHVRLSDLTSLKSFRGLQSYDKDISQAHCKVGLQIACASTAEVRRSQRGPSGGSPGALNSKLGARGQVKLATMLSVAVCTFQNSSLWY